MKKTTIQIKTTDCQVSSTTQMTKRSQRMQHLWYLPRSTTHHTRGFSISTSWQRERLYGAQARRRESWWVYKLFQAKATLVSLRNKCLQRLPTLGVFHSSPITTILLWKVRMMTVATTPQLVSVFFLDTARVDVSRFGAFVVEKETGARSPRVLSPLSSRLVSSFVPSSSLPRSMASHLTMPAPSRKWRGRRKSLLKPCRQLFRPQTREAEVLLCFCPSRIRWCLTSGGISSEPLVYEASLCKLNGVSSAFSSTRARIRSHRRIQTRAACTSGGRKG